MALFFVLPPRELLEHAIAEFAARLLPGVPLPLDLTEHFLTAILAAQRENYLIHREDLPDTDDLAQTLVEAFGAEPGDRVVDIGSPRILGTAPVRTVLVSANALAR